MATAFFGSNFFGGEFFSATGVDEVIKTGTGGIDPQKRKTIHKPTGLVERKKEGKKGVEQRVDESRQIQAEIAGRLAREFAEETRGIQEATLEAKRIEEMSASEVDREIGVLLKKKLQTEEEELMLLLMIAANE
jgi:hypothetical protein